jgi:hypothetical protein
MSEQQTAAPDAALQILITEHTNLQAARSATVFEANGRTTLFLGAVSSGIVALAFIGQASQRCRLWRLRFLLDALPAPALEGTGAPLDGALSVRAQTPAVAD